MKRVILESPYRGSATPQSTKAVDAAIICNNTKYAQLCVLDCLKRGESPLVSHLLFTQVLDDNNPDQRKLGMEAGQAWYKSATYLVVYTDLGISDGMKEGIALAESLGLLIHYRKLNA